MPIPTQACRKRKVDSVSTGTYSNEWSLLPSVTPRAVLFSPPLSAPPSEPIDVLAAVVKRDGTYLVCQRPAHKRHGGLWEFPGGKLEANESLFDAARRELAEELGVSAVAVEAPLFSVADPGSVFVIRFVPTEIDGEPECLEHTALRWATLSELPSLDLAPSDRRFVEHLLKHVG